MEDFSSSWEYPTLGQKKDFVFSLLFFSFSLPPLDISKKNFKYHKSGLAINGERVSSKIKRKNPKDNQKI